MIVTIELNELETGFREKVRQMLTKCDAAGLNMLVYCGRRTYEDQARLYRRGRALKDIQKMAEQLGKKYKRPDLKEILLGVGPQYGKKVTNAAPGQSMHNYGLAIDGAPMVYGKPLWTTEGPDGQFWKLYGKVAEKVGLEWAGGWRSFKEYPHVQEIGSNWRDLLKGTVGSNTA